MAQHDLTIANQTFPSARADLNNVIQALASCAAGDAEPPTTVGGMWWFDTSNNLLKFRNEANTAWISIAEITASGFRLVVSELQAADGGGLEFKTDEGTARVRLRDSGKLEALVGFIGSLEGNAATATRLATARRIGGVEFDGTADITLPLQSLEKASEADAQAGTDDAKYMTPAKVVAAIDEHRVVPLAGEIASLETYTAGGGTQFNDPVLPGEIEGTDIRSELSGRWRLLCQTGTVRGSYTTGNPNTGIQTHYFTVSRTGLYQRFE